MWAGIHHVLQSPKARRKYIMVKTTMQLISPPCATLAKGDALGLLQPLNRAPALIAHPTLPFWSQGHLSSHHLQGWGAVALTVFSCALHAMAALGPPNLHCRLMCKQSQGGLRFNSWVQLTCWLPFAKAKKVKKLFFTPVSCGKMQGQCKEKEKFWKYSQLLFWQMATVTFWTLMGKANVVSKEENR